MRTERANRGRVIVIAVAALLAHGTSFAQQRKPATETRDALVGRARVWTRTDIPSMDLRVGPTGPGAFAPEAAITCDYVEKKLGGASPKFACRLPDGDELKVKYGGANGEVYAEVAASRLLWALGFGADRMYSVRVICRGCPERIAGILRGNGDLVVDPAAVERKLDGKELLDAWDWDELNGTGRAVGTSERAERDAFKLLAVLLQHTDSKSKQQRMVCRGGAPSKDGRCALPLMMINDLGLTFGSSNALNQQPSASVHLVKWASLPIWKDAESCVGNLPGSLTGTLKNPVISEAGRHFLASLLVQLSDRQIRDMFEAARVHLRPRVPEDGALGFPSADEWVKAFNQKRAEIVERRCPS